MGLLEVLTLVFVVLKLLGVIAWSWWYVFLPLIVSAGIYVIIISVNLYGFISTSRKIRRSFDDDFFK